MILYTTLATISAVALGLALNVARKQVRGLTRELKKKTSLVFKYETQLLDYRAEVAGANDKAKTWEGRGEELTRRCLVAENDLAGALQKLFVLEEREAVRRENARIRKVNQRAREKGDKMSNNKQTTHTCVFEKSATSNSNEAKCKHCNNVRYLIDVKLNNETFGGNNGQ